MYFCFHFIRRWYENTDVLIFSARTYIIISDAACESFIRCIFEHGDWYFTRPTFPGCEKWQAKFSGTYYNIVVEVCGTRFNSKAKTIEGLFSSVKKKKTKKNYHLHYRKWRPTARLARVAKKYQRACVCTCMCGRTSCALYINPFSE